MRDQQLKRSSYDFRIMQHMQNATLFHLNELDLYPESRCHSAGKDSSRLRFE